VKEIKQKEIKDKDKIEYLIAMGKHKELIDLIIKETSRQIFGFSEQNWNNSETYRKVLHHRRTCPLWDTHQLCLECFGGGLTKFTEDLRKELKKKWVK